MATYFRLPSSDNLAKLFLLRTRSLGRWHVVHEHVRYTVVENSAGYAAFAEDQERQPQSEENSGLEVIPWGWE